MRITPIALALILGAAACQQPAADAPPAPVPEGDQNAPDAPAVPPAPDADATAPGQPGGLPDDRTPVAEGPIDPQSPQGAGQVLQAYFGALEAKDYAAAWKLWSDGGKASGQDVAAFAAGFADIAEYHAEIGAPGDAEGAAGSVYVEVPVRVYGRMKDGRSFSDRGIAALRRVNDVPGASAEQRKWRIHNISVAPPTR